VDFRAFPLAGTEPARPGWMKISVKTTRKRSVISRMNFAMESASLGATGNPAYCEQTRGREVKNNPLILFVHRFSKVKVQRFCSKGE